MDEIFMSRDSEDNSKYYWVLNDISTPWKSNNIRVDEGRKKEDVVKRLSELEHQDAVIAVCIDMWKPYRDAIHEVFPNAVVVIDPFHVIQAAQREMENVRKGANVNKDIKSALKKDSRLFSTSIFKLKDDQLDRLESYLQASSDIENAYFIVQELLGLYRKKDYDDALNYLSQWESTVSESGIHEMINVLHTVQNWLPYILNHFIYRISNGKTEGKNHMIRVIDKIGFHYGIDALQGCIYAHDRKQEYIKWQKYLRRKENELKGKEDILTAA
jgi:transposase